MTTSCESLLQLREARGLAESFGRGRDCRTLIPAPKSETAPREIDWRRVLRSRCKNDNDCNPDSPACNRPRRFKSEPRHDLQFENEEWNSRTAAAAMVNPWPGAQ